MTTQDNTIEIIAHVADSPRVYRESDKVPFVRCLFTVTQTKRETNDWEKVSAYPKVIQAYRKLVDLFELFQTGDELQLRCKTVSKLQQDKQGMFSELSDWIAVAVKPLDAATERRLINGITADKPRVQENTAQVTPAPCATA